ncbi:MAG: hypothetical protein DHS20C15_04010 [Planctomycetota bacterium]|nr:MAG: hypothetical protein DHS20C15_04010 [Planctomycetota bacterium]
MTEWLVFATLLVVGGVVAVSRLRHHGALARLAPEEPEAERAPAAMVSTRADARRRARDLVLAMLFGLAVALSVIVLAPFTPAIGLALGVLVFQIAWMLLDLLARRYRIRLEVQLAEALDMTVAGLRAGSSPADALDRAFREAPRPLGAFVGDLVERLRLGERPLEVFALLERRLPLEGVRLFRFALAAHWEGGGSLSPTLAAVARSTRDRVTVERRVLAQSSEAQWSVFGVLAITYGLAVLLSRSDEQRVLTFLGTALAGWLVPAAILLQVAGIAWMARITRLEV